MGPITNHEDMALNGYAPIAEIPQDRLAEIIDRKTGEVVEVFIPAATVGLNVHVKMHSPDGKSIDRQTPGKYVKHINGGYTAVLGRVLSITEDESGKKYFEFMPIERDEVIDDVICYFDLELLTQGGLCIDFDADAVHQHNQYRATVDQ